MKTVDLSKRMAARTDSRRPSAMLLVLTLVLVIGLGHSIGLAQEAVVLVGSGSSVPAPLYNKWVEEYNKRDTGIQVSTFRWVRWRA